MKIIVSYDGEKIGEITSGQRMKLNECLDLLDVSEEDRKYYALRPNLFEIEFAAPQISDWFSTKQVSEKYNIARQNVLIACKSGKLTEDEAVKTSIGWLIKPEAAERIWERRDAE